MENNINTYLESIGVSFDAVFVGETVRDNEWTCDEWRITLKRQGKSDVREAFYTGTGLRKQVMPMPPPACRKGTLAYEAWAKTVFKAQAPSAATVLHSLLIDASAIEQSFADWCSDFGYESDSIKALNTYNACCAVGQTLRDFFSPDERETLRDMLQDF